jgi:hypothetical protein
MSLPSSTLKKEAACSSKTLTDFQLTTSVIFKQRELFRKIIILLYSFESGICMHTRISVQRNPNDTSICA